MLPASGGGAHAAERHVGQDLGVDLSQGCLPQFNMV